jgi:hypothetical protein
MSKINEIQKDAEQRAFRATHKRLANSEVLQYFDKEDVKHLLRMSDDNSQFHEPANQCLKAKVKGKSFDNTMCDRSELYIELTQGGEVRCELNLALLLALAADRLKIAKEALI